MTEFTERQIWYLHKEFGASLRSVTNFADRPSEYEGFLRDKVAEVNADRLPRIFREPESHPLSHSIITIRPRPDSHAMRWKEFASRRVFKMLWEQHAKNRLDLTSAFYDVFRSHAIGPASAGWIFEFRIHQVLTERQTLQLLRMQGHVAGVDYVYETTPDRIALELAASSEATFVEGADLQPNKYYRLDSDTLPGIDSLLLVTPSDASLPILLMFQITHNRSDHDMNLADLEKVDRLGAPPSTRRYRVVVTPEGIHPKITVPAKYFEDAGLRELTSDEAFPVFHYPLRTDELFGG